MKGALNTLKMLGIKIAVTTFGAGVVLSVVSNEYYKWTKDRSGDWVKRKEQDISWVRLFIKIGLVIIGVVLFVIISVLITVLETVHGLIFNFDWKHLLNNAKE